MVLLSYNFTPAEAQLLATQANTCARPQHQQLMAMSMMVGDGRARVMISRVTCLGLSDCPGNTNASQYAPQPAAATSPTGKDAVEAASPPAAHRQPPSMLRLLIDACNSEGGGSNAEGMRELVQDPDMETTPIGITQECYRVAAIAAGWGDRAAVVLQLPYASWQDSNTRHGSSLRARSVSRVLWRFQRPSARHGCVHQAGETVPSARLGRQPAPCRAQCWQRYPRRPHQSN